MVTPVVGHVGTVLTEFLSNCAGFAWVNILRVSWDRVSFCLVFFMDETVLLWFGLDPGNTETHLGGLEDFPDQSVYVLIGRNELHPSGILVHPGTGKRAGPGSE